MRPLTVTIALAMMLSVALWTLHPADSFAERAGVSAHASGVVIGKTVRAESGAVLGKVENIVLTDQGCAEYLILSGSFSGARGRWYPVPWTVISRSSADAVFVNLDPANFVEAPSFPARKLPDFTQREFSTRITTFYQEKAHISTQGRTGVRESGREGAAVRSEEKAKMKTGRKGPFDKPAASGAPEATEQRGKKESDVKSQELEKSKERQMKQSAPGKMMEKERQKIEPRSHPEGAVEKHERGMKEGAKEGVKERGYETPARQGAPSAVEPPVKKESDVKSHQPAKPREGQITPGAGVEREPQKVAPEKHPGAMPEKPEKGSKEEKRPMM